MVKYDDYQLDAVFNALADPTRREILTRLGRGPLQVSRLAEPFDMSLAAVSKHLNVLEDAGLIERSRQGRKVNCELQLDAFSYIRQWVEYHERFWAGRLAALNDLLKKQKRRKK